ncbi:MAG TPA: hypothetical protein EYP19_17140 [Desulfobacterales bacterium]|nr:hypothetical protein [Desulfobacterales bacterium]
MRKVRARKQHECHSCAGVIHRGEEYWIDDSYVAKFYGNYGSPYRWCTKCVNLTTQGGRENEEMGMDSK